jgi:2-iminobutanoate/2-iminopropanoate deaminase
MHGVILTTEGARAVGPYSQAIKTADAIFVSGQIALDPATGVIVAGGVEAHTDRAIRNIEAILKAAGTDLGHVVRCVVYLTEMEHFAAMNNAYERFFGPVRPARTTVAVAALPLGSLVEIEATAVCV